MTPGREALKDPSERMRSLREEGGQDGTAHRGRRSLRARLGLRALADSAPMVSADTNAAIDCTGLNLKVRMSSAR